MARPQGTSSQGKEKPASVPPEEWRDWEEIVIPVPDDAVESEEKRPLQQILAEAREEAKKKAEE